MTVKILAGIDRQPLTYSDKIGFDTEDRVLKMFNHFKKKGLIKSAKLALRFSPDDRAGKDMEVCLLTNEKIYIQIAASFHRDDQLKSLRAGIYYLVIHLNDTNEILYQIIRGIILSAYLNHHNEGRQIAIMRKILPMLIQNYQEEKIGFWEWIKTCPIFR
jgi:hypothetical protein